MNGYRGTLGAPFIVKAIPTEKNQQETADDARDKDDKRWNDRVTIFIGIATAVILCLQLGVFGWQAHRLKQTIVTMKELGTQQSTDMQASIEAARRLADSDRPHLIPDIFKISGIRQTPESNGQIRSRFEYRFINYGRSPAFMKTVCFMVRIGKELDPAPQYGEPTQTNHIVVVNGWYGSIEPSGALLSAKDAADILSGECNYFIYGYIEYADVANQMHKMRFAYSFLFGEGDISERFDPAGPKSYREYT